MATVEAITAIDDPDEQARAAHDAIERARAFVTTLIPVRDNALRAMRRAGLSYGSIADLTGMPKATVVSITRLEPTPAVTSAAATAADVDL